MKSPRLRHFVAGAIGVLSMFAMTTAGSTIQASAAAKKPIVIGVSVSLSGDFSGDGHNILEGYKLWVKDVNRSGGLLGRPVQLKYLDDASSVSQETTNYQTLIGTDHVNLVLGPYSSLLTLPALTVAHRYGYLMLGPAGGAPKIFNLHYNNYAFVQPAPVVDNLMTFVNFIRSLPASQRPKTAAYATSNDPFTEPQLVVARQALTKLGVKSVYYQVFPDETPDLQPEALAIAQSHAQVVLLGVTSVPQIQAFIQTFVQQKYNPKALVATAGADQGAQFSSAVGIKNTGGIMVPEGWTPHLKTYQNQQFVKEYLATYGGSMNAISADVPQAYSVGQIIQQLVAKTHSINNAVLIKAMHKYTFQTVQGPMKFNVYGEPNGSSWLAQWQNGVTRIIYPPKNATAKPLFPKPNWGQ